MRVGNRFQEFFPELIDLGARLICDVWGTDFSQEMLDRARAKLSSARFFLHDLRKPFPKPLQRRFDRIVCAYVFQHFALDEKVALGERLAREHLAPDGRLVIADISFETQQALEAVREAVGDEWEEELYWIRLSTLDSRPSPLDSSLFPNCLVALVPNPFLQLSSLVSLVFTAME